MQQNPATIEIRSNFRKEIRRRHIDTIFAIKRKLISEEINKERDKQKNTERLDKLYEELRTKKNLGKVLVRLGTYLFDENCLLTFSEEFGYENMQTLCVHIATFIFINLVPSLKLQGIEGEECLKHCLAVISNMMADKESPQNILIPIISESLMTHFNEIRTMLNEQVVEIGWILSNSFCHELDLSLESGLEKSIEDMLTMSQEIMLTSNLEILGQLYKNVNKFFMYTDHYFGSKFSEKQQIEHYKVQRMILLENSVEFNMKIEMGTSLLEILPFIENNLSYASSCSEKMHLEICEKGFELIGCNGSEKIMKAAFSIIRQLVRDDKAIIITIVHKYFDTLISCLMHNGVNIKIETIKTICCLCLDYEITSFLVENKSLEVVVKELIEIARDQDTQIELIMLTDKILQKTERKYGNFALEAISKYLMHRTGDLGKEAIAIVEHYEQQMD